MMRRRRRRRRRNSWRIAALLAATSAASGSNPRRLCRTLPSSVVSALQGDILASVAPLVRAAVAELVGEVVVVEVHAVHVVVDVLPVLLAVHEDLHGLAALLQGAHGQDEQERRPPL